ncbi:MAG: LacI family transcriptional regulator [Firmicutes bacterium]|jgi:LacI family transcriptional regulator|nr:LacI family transcriptional regulator [Bacillota bacterium]
MRKKRKIPTLKDVAKLAGTSVSTASVVLSGTQKKFVSDTLRQRVLEAAKVLNYRPNITARQMKGKSGRFLAILAPQFDNVFFNQVVIGAESYANSRDYTLAIYSTYDQEEKELKFVDNLISLQVDGILLIPAQQKSRTVEMIRDAEIPYVVVDRPIFSDEHYELVAIDNYQAARDATEYLLSCGHTRIAFFGWESPLTTVTERIHGFRDALLAAGIKPDPKGIVEVPRERGAAFQAAMEVLPGSDYTAVLAAQSNVGEGVVDALFQLGWEIPERMSVMLYGDPPWASLFRPKFSCVVQPHQQLGMKAAELIIDRLENPHHEIRCEVFKAALHVRDSVMDYRGLRAINS